MQILLIHQGFPGQFKHLVPALQAQGHRLTVISKTRPAASIPAGVNYISYTLQRGNTEGIHPLALELETKVIRAEAVAVQALSLQKHGFWPDLILGHPGWGEMLFLSDIWPDVPQIHYVEFFHGVPGTDNDFDGGLQESPLDPWDRAKARMKNAHHLSSLNQMTTGITPTQFQHSVLPGWAQERTHIIHDGIDTDWLFPNPNAELQIPNGPLLRAGDPVITFINRTFEPYRGVHVFLEALALLQANHPTAQTLLVGKDSAKVSYGRHRHDGIGWLTALKRQHGSRLDWSRIHHLGTIPHTTLRTVYQISAAHVYLSYPFVLSWSLLEAMSCGCLVIGSATAPVQEVIKDKKNGLLVAFNDPQALTCILLNALNHAQELMPLRMQARRYIQSNYDLRQCLSQQITLIQKTVDSAS